MKNLFIFSITLLSVVIFTNTMMCPKFACPEGSSKTCGSVRATGKDFGFNLVSLSDICEKSETCEIAQQNWTSLAMLEEDKLYTCKPTNSAVTRSFPGEQCSRNEDCQKNGEGTGDCIESTCTGILEMEECHTHSQCLAGSYCDVDECRPQKEFGLTCEDSVECVNQYLCHNGTCSLAPFSLDVGEPVGDKDSMEDYKCKFQQFDSHRKCTKLIQYETGDAEGFVKCNVGDFCKYRLFGEGPELSIPCDCGFNADGTGYCPIGHNKSNSIINFR
jgi:hypothetical protein